MENQMLKRNDFVRYKTQNESLDLMGLKIGRIYMIKTNVHGGLYIENNEETTAVLLVDSQGMFTDFVDHFTMYQVEMDLPIGRL